jgi:CBS domain-containing protein
MARHQAVAPGNTGVHANGLFVTKGAAVRVGKAMSKGVQTIAPDRTLRDAAALMRQADIGVLPVAENDKLIGMITDRDIAIRGIGAGMGPDATVRQAMSQEVKYCFEDEEIDHVAQNMADLQVRRLPVMNRDKRLVGILLPRTSLHRVLAGRNDSSAAGRQPHRLSHRR